MTPRSPFPGMDPYLERSALWPAFHFRLIGAIAAALEPQLSQRYYIEVETRSYHSSDSEDDGEPLLIGIPDAAVVARGTVGTDTATDTASQAAVATATLPQRVTLPMPKPVHERYLEVRTVDNDAVIAALEVLSPKNKRPGPGRQAYEGKRQSLLTSTTHLVEIDLLRGGQPMAMAGVTAVTTYRVLVSRSDQRPAADLYGVALSQPLPVVPVPLQPGEAEPLLDLQAALDKVYHEARYGLRLDYHQPVPPPRLDPAEQDWVDHQLRAVR